MSNLIPDVRIIIEDLGEYGERSRINVFVNGERIGGGRIGGEPEDNMRHRDYAWIETTLEELARRLGAQVSIQSSQETD